MTNGRVVHRSIASDRNSSLKEQDAVSDVERPREGGGGGMWAGVILNELMISQCFISTLIPFRERRVAF